MRKFPLPYNANTMVGKLKLMFQGTIILSKTDRPCKFNSGHKKTAPPRECSTEVKGVGRNRTDDEAFAEPCLTTWLPRRINILKFRIICAWVMQDYFIKKESKLLQA